MIQHINDLELELFVLNTTQTLERLKSSKGEVLHTWYQGAIPTSIQPVDITLIKGDTAIFKASVDNFVSLPEYDADKYELRLLNILFGVYCDNFNELTVGFSIISNRLRNMELSQTTDCDILASQNALHHEYAKKILSYDLSLLGFIAFCNSYVRS